MTRDEVMAKLETLGTEQVRKMNAKNGSGDNQFGVKMGDLRILANEIKLNPELAKELWETGNWDARLLSTLLMKPKKLSADEVHEMVADIHFIPNATTSQLSDWVMTNVLKVHPEKEALRQKWMTAKDVMPARAGWSLTAERAAKSPEGLDASALLDRIEKEMPSAPPVLQWTMNYALANIGINFPDLRQRALDIGERLGVFRDYPTSKGCTSPFAPIWIDYFVSRQ